MAEIDSRYLFNVQIIRFDVPRGSNLPFYLLAWAQLELAQHVCKQGCKMTDKLYTRNSHLFTQWCTFCDSTSKRGSIIDYVREISRVLSERIARKPIPNFLEKSRYVYYTESDQVLTINDPETLRRITAASNLTSVILGRRRYKQGLKFPNSYDKILARGPGCGREGFFISGFGVREELSVS